MELNRLGITPIVIFNFIIWMFFTFAYFYQVVYIFVVLRRGTVKLPDAKRRHRYAFFIAAHNEESVIANLVRSIKEQDYPAELIGDYKCLRELVEYGFAQAVNLIIVDRKSVV